MNWPIRSPRKLLLITFAFAAVSLACFAFPLYVIRPFRHQGASELAVALFVKQIGPILSVGSTVLAGVVTVFTWRQTPSWRIRSAALCFLILAAGGVYLSRLNVYELMFHPLGPPQFESAGKAHVDREDMVIAVRVNGVARAYPIREMAYHHIVNDTVGGEPIVSTY